LSWSFRQAAGWQTIYRATLFIALGMLAAFLSMIANVRMPGLQQRGSGLLCIVRKFDVADLVNLLIDAESQKAA
jgi:hypothetical protein